MSASRKNIGGEEETLSFDELESIACMYREEALVAVRKAASAALQRAHNGMKQCQHLAAGEGDRRQEYRQPPAHC